MITYIIQPCVREPVEHVGAPCRSARPTSASRTSPKRRSSGPSRRALHDRGDEANAEQREAVLARPPAEAEMRVEHPRRLQHQLREDDQREHERPGCRSRGAGRASSSARERVGPGERERRAPLLRQRFGHEKVAVSRVEQRKARRRRKNGRRRSMPPSRPPIIGPKMKPEAEGRADQAEALGALLRRSDVGRVGVRHREARPGRAADQPREQHPAERRARAPAAGSATPSPSIDHSRIGRRPKRSESAPSSGAQKNCISAVGDDQRAVPVGLQLAARRELAHQHRQHRQRDPDAEHVDEHDDEDERDPRLAAPAGSGLDSRRGCQPAYVHSTR